MAQLKKDKNNPDIKELTNKELRDEILKINNNQLSKIGNMSVHYFISKSGELLQKMNRDNFENIIKESKEREVLFKKFNEIVNSFKTIKEVISEEELEKELEGLLESRKEVYDLYEVLHAYEIELFYVKELLDQQTMKVVGKREYRNIPLSKQNTKLLINKLDRVLDENIKDDSKFINIISNMLSIMPFRMTKGKFFHMLKENLTENYSEYPAEIVENKIREYKMFFDSSLMGDYGIIFGEFFAKIQNLKNKNIEKLSLVELEEIEDYILSIMEEIKDYKIFINNIGVLLNRLIVVLLIQDKIIWDKDLKDIFTNWQEFQSKPDKKLLESIILKSNKSLEEMEKSLLGDVDYFQSINNEGISRKDFFDKELDREVLFAKKVLTYYNDVEFTKHDLLIFKNQEIVREDYLGQLIDNLIQYINRSIIGMKNIERKLRMRRLLSILELPFKNIEEFLSYIEYSLDERVASKEEILFTIDTANYWLGGFNKEN